MHSHHELQSFTTYCQLSCLLLLLMMHVCQLAHASWLTALPSAQVVSVVG